MAGSIAQQFGGMSVLDYGTGSNQYVYAEGVDVKRNIQYLQLERKPVLGFTTTGLMLCTLEIPKWGTVLGVPSYPNYFLGEGGDVYYSDGTPGVGVKVGAGLCGGNDIVNAILFNLNGDLHYILYAVDDYTNPTKGWIYKVRLADITPGIGVGSWTGHSVLVDGGVPGFDVGFGQCYSFINESNRLLYYVKANEIWSLDYLAIYRSRIMTDFNITGLTKHGQLYRVYTHLAKIYYRDGYSKFFDSSIKISYNVRYAWNQGDVDYVVLGRDEDNSMLGLFSGQQLQFLNKVTKSDLAGLVKYRYYIDNVGSNYTMAQYGNIVYTPIKGVLAGSSYMGIASYGAEYFGFPRGFFMEVNQNSYGRNMTKIGCVSNPMNLGMNLWYSFKDTSNVYGVDMLNLSPNGTPSYVSSGTLFTKRMDELLTKTKLSPSPRRNKRVLEMNLRANIPTGTQIQIYTATDGSSSYNLLTTITPATLANRDGLRWRQYGLPIDTVYYDMSFKVVWSTSNSAVTPKFYDLFFTSEEVKS